MRFQPKTEREIAEAGLLPAGEYDFEVLEAEDTQSKAGNDMVALKLSVYDKDGATRRVDDWLVDTDGGAYKIRHFASATGLLTLYEKGSLPASEMIGRVGRCKIAIRKDKTGNYPDKNSVTDYVKAPEKEQSDAVPKRAPATVAQELDDDIPF